jgi:transcriptional regulator with XRE-family HTH domain
MNKLRIWRAEKGLTLDEAANLLKMSRSSLHLIESGRLAPSKSQRELLERYFASDSEALLRPIRAGLK